MAKEEKPMKSEEDFLRTLQEKITKKVEGSDLKPGRIYVVYESKPKLSYALFQDLQKMGRVGICVSRNSAERILEEYNVKPEIFIWITGIAGKNNLPPTSIGILTRYLAETIEKKPGCAVLIDALDTLILNNKFQPVMRMVETIYDQVMRTNSICIIPVMKETLSTQDLAYLVRNLEVIE
ncbi:MAG: DUF835 domain-containing protein [Thermoplasmata archaeon]